MVKAPVLSCPDFDETFFLQTDASFSEVGALLTQGGLNGEEFIAYASKSLTDVEKKYSVTEKELLAVLSVGVYLCQGALGHCPGNFFCSPNYKSH